MEAARRALAGLHQVDLAAADDAALFATVLAMQELRGSLEAAEAGVLAV